jgi:hypothetical protein
VQYARYDLTLNQSFYRNMALVTAAISVGIAVLGFLGRWRSSVSFLGNDDMDFTNQYTVTITTFFITMVVGIMSIVFAGCIHHPLRTKQSRISVLTLPATNAEKFLWHTLLVIVGGAIVCFGSVLLADGFNALLSLLVGFPTDQIYSITAEHLRYYTLSMNWGPFYELELMRNDPIGREVLSYVIACGYAGAIWGVSAYAFGNAVKYRYNIIWTVLALQVLNFALTVLTVICSISFGEAFMKWVETTSVEWTREDGIMAYRTFFITIISLTLATSALMWWGNWKLYKKAQITSKLNR